SFAYQTVATACHLLGEWDAGRAAARQCLALDAGEQLATIRAAAFLAWMEGSYSDGIHRLQGVLTSARARRDMQGLSLSLATLADWMLELDRPEDAHAPAREAAELLRTGGSWQPWPGFAFGPLAETAVRLGAPDAEDVLAEGEQQVESSEQYLGRPQLLRARGLLCERKGKLDRALEALHAGAEVARSQ